MPAGQHSHIKLSMWLFTFIFVFIMTRFYFFGKMLITKKKFSVFLEHTFLCLFYLLDVQILNMHVENFKIKQMSLLK